MAQKRDVVLFLGAGFSHDGALPTMDGFGDESVRQFSSDTIQENKRQASEMFRFSGKIFHQFQKYCENNKVVKLNVKNMEEVFCVAEALNESGEKSINLEGKSIQPNDLIEKIQLWLWKIYQQCPPLNAARSQEVNRASYERFMSLINSNKMASRVTVLTTNYDLLFEYFAWGNGIECSYPFKSGTYQTIQAGVRTEVYASPEQQDNAALICKLHGSVNFFEGGNLSPNKLGICNDVTLPGDMIGRSGTPEPKRPAVFAFDAIWNLRQGIHGDVIPAIIPPTYAKLQQKAWLQDTWNMAVHSLSRAKKIIFIGYSFPQTDGFVKAMLQAAFTLQDCNPMIYVVDPDKNGIVFSRCEETFTKFKEENFIKMKFSEFVSSPQFEEILSVDKAA